ncbi:hypothetical protein HELRODRAFT_136214, partial [Helobdella robusta]|uniref:Receptor L-domain domain-containing protein n=1 Tax=Helobdella robusta TaxID=6412 RepID=T1EIC8_HELRO
MKTCTIVNGNIQITLLDGTYYTTVYNYSYEYLSLPLLREVTGYVLLNHNLLFRSFAYLFPNLAIIGGSSLFNGYALVLMNNYQLEEIGLPKLNVILNGGIRIHGHPKLCYAGSIKWNYIMRNSERFVFSTNKDQKLCFNKCPMYNNGSSMCP